jgi:hypothetical protein
LQAGASHKWCPLFYFILKKDEDYIMIIYRKEFLKVTNSKGISTLVQNHATPSEFRKGFVRLIPIAKLSIVLEDSLSKKQKVFVDELYNEFSNNAMTEIDVYKAYTIERV